MNIFQFSTKQPFFSSLFLLIGTAFFALGLEKLEVDTGVESLIPVDDPAHMVYQKIMGEFGSDNKTIIYVRDENLWSPEKLHELHEFHKQLQSLPYVKRVEDLFTVHTIDQVEDRIDSSPLIDAIPETVDEAKVLKQRSQSNPLYLGNFLSDDGNVTAILVGIDDVSENVNYDLEFHEELTEVIAANQEHFSEVFEVGPPRIRAELQNNLYQDFILLGPLSAAVLILSILLFMRSWLAAIVPLVTSALSIVWTFGMLGWAGVPINILSAMLPSLIIVIGSTEDTHIMAAFRRGMLQSSIKNKKSAIEYMGKHIGLPLVLTVLTTALGFASNLFGRLELIQDFAIASTFAIVANGLITVLAVPLMLSWFSPEKKADEPLGEDKPFWIIRVFRHSQEHYPLATLFMTALLCGFFIYHASKLYVTNDPLSYFPDHMPLIKNTEQIHQDLSGIKLFFITLEARTQKAFQEPENIAKLSEIQQFIEKQGAFDQSISLADFLSFVNQRFQNEQHGLPDSRELISQYLLFFHRNDLQSYVNHSYSRANIIVRHNINASHELNAYIEELREVVDKISGPDIRAYIVGKNLMVNQAAESLMVAQVKALLLLLLLIFIIMSIMFTSPKGGAIALIPAVIPISLMFGIMGLLEIPLNPGTAMVAVIAVGIAIDGTIHLLARYNELCRTCSDYQTAVHQAVDEESTPLITASLALALGFGILLFSHFSVIAQFGALAAATMLFSIFANLLITPIIMSRIRLVGLYQICVMKVDPCVFENSPLFNNMTPYQRRKAILISELREFDAGELLVEQDTHCRDMFLILKGEAEVIRRSDHNNATTLAELSAGQVFGEIGYIRETCRTADVRAKSPITALRFDFERMKKDLKYFPNIVAQLNFNISYILGERLAEMVEKQQG